MSVGVMVVVNDGRTLEVQGAAVAEPADKVRSNVYAIPGVVQQNDRKKGVEIGGE